MQKLLRITARVLSVLLVAFLILVSTDIFAMEYSWREALTGFLVHSAPAYPLAFAFLLAWKLPAWGGLFYIALGIASIYIFNTYKNFAAFVIVTVLPVFIGFMYLYEGTRD